MVAHCSAGVGRTGTFIAIDYTIQKIKKDGEIDLFNLVNDMRQSRPAMVQTEAQYIFCHDAVLDYIRCGETEVSAGSLQSHIQELYKVDQSVGVSGIRHELQLLNKVSPPKSLFKFSAALDQANIYKNRYSDILAADDHRVNLEAVPGHPAHSTYINATFVDGYTRHNMYITTQGPVTNTIPDFWRMLWEQDSDMIVMLTELHEDGSTMCARYWPSQGTGDYDLFSVILEHEKSYGDYVIRKLQVANKKVCLVFLLLLVPDFGCLWFGQESSVRSVTQFHYTCWHNNHVPQSASSLIEIIGRVDRTQLHAGTSPLIVVCNDGVGRSGTYCAISIIIDRLKTEQVVDVFQVVKAMRIHNPGYIARLEDYQFCYNAAAEFLEAFDTYANFKSS
jgi:netrin-G3 ligand